MPSGTEPAKLNMILMFGCRWMNDWIDEGQMSGQIVKNRRETRVPEGFLLKLTN